MVCLTKSLLFLAVLCLSLATVSAVFNGIPIENMADWPWVARLREDAPYPVFRSSWCSASIIGPRHILTAAHCLRVSNELRAIVNNLTYGIWYDMTVLTTNSTTIPYAHVGAPHLNDSIRVPIARFSFPPDFTNMIMPFVLDNPLNWVTDIAMLELAYPLNFTSTMQPIALPKKIDQIEPNDNRIAYVAGWGGREQAKYGTVQLALNEYCANESVLYYDYWINNQSLYDTTPRGLYTNGLTGAQLEEIHENMTIAFEEGLICLKPNPNNMAGGDSGGICMVRDKCNKMFQIGVIQNIYRRTNAADISQGINDSGRVASECTRTDVHCDWIEEQTNGEVQCREFE